MANRSNDWTAGRATNRRLAVCLAVSTFAVSALVLLVRVELPLAIRARDAAPLTIEIAKQDPAAQATEPELEPDPELPEELPSPAEAAEPAVAELEELVEQPPAEPEQPAIDWYAAMEQAVIEAGDKAQIPEGPMMMYPEYNELRRVAAIRYYEGPDPPPTWRENIGIDQLGRTVIYLNGGQCYQVLSDPSAAAQWEFENFTRHIVYCYNVINPRPKKLGFVDEIVAAREYLNEEQPGLPALP